MRFGRLPAVSILWEAGFSIMWDQVVFSYPRGYNRRNKCKVKIDEAKRQRGE